MAGAVVGIELATTRAAVVETRYDTGNRCGPGAFGFPFAVVAMGSRHNADGYYLLRWTFPLAVVFYRKKLRLTLRRQ